ncbi:MAG: putative ABC transport system permease protein [Candidatus Azotimanducaceae bacterium]|jgi:putative ABC transport system permease protein
MLRFFKIFQEGLRFAWHALVVNKLRSLLSLLGVTIGIFAIIAVFTVVDALEGNIRSSVASLGSDVLYVQKWPWGTGGDYDWWKYMSRPVPQQNELRELKERLVSAEAIVYSVNSSKTVKRGSLSVENSMIQGVSHDYYKVSAIDISLGRYFTTLESATGKNVCIIGASISEGLFPVDENPIGEVIKISGRKLIIIGVLKKVGKSIVGPDVDEQVIIPVAFAQNIFNIRSERANPMLIVKAKENLPLQMMKDELRVNMRSIRRLKPKAVDNFALNETSMLSGSLDSLFSVISGAGWLIGGFSILVGGFGIANIMFVSVKERTGLIGIQKSLGAKSYFILLQFLFESVFLCVIGGAIGLLLVGGIAFAVDSMLDFGLELTMNNVVLGLSVSAVIGLISGFIPAYTAAKLDPVEAIRSGQ